MIVEADVAGYKALFSAIINKAIVDSICYRNPNKRVLKRKKRNLRKSFIFAVSNYHLMLDKDLSIPIFLYFAMEKIFLWMNKEPSNSHEKAYLARKFINHQNPNFCDYLFHLGIDPIYAAERLKKQINHFDKTGENFLKKIKRSIDFLKVNM